MGGEDIRWKQRYKNYCGALAQLREAVALAKTRRLTRLEEQGLIQAFEFTNELAWKMIKDFFESQGDTAIQGSRDAFRLAFKRNLIKNGDVWMEMVKSRALTVHTYNEKTAIMVAEAVIGSYFREFEELRETFFKLAEKD